MSRIEQHPSDGVDAGREQLLAAMSSAKDAPDRDDAWDRVEQLASSLDCPDEVVELYGEMVRRDLPADVIAHLGDRATKFHEEWFGEASPALADVLVRVLEVEPKSDAALQRLTVVYTVQGRWNDLLDQYDRVLEATRSTRRRGKLLEEAANLAKDLAGLPERAAGYLQQLLVLRPTDAGLAVTLERLLERQERYDDLVELWRSRLAALEGPDAHRTRVRIARAELEKRGDAAAALAELQALLQAGGDADDVDELLGEVLRREDAAAETRLAALALLRPRFRASGESKMLVAALELALEIADPETRQALREEAGALLAEAGEGGAAMDHIAAMLERDPANARARADIRRIADTTGAHTALVVALAGAGMAAGAGPLAVDLLREAASVRRRACGDPGGAAELLALAIDAAGDDAALAVAAGRERVSALRAAEQDDLLLGALQALVALQGPGAALDELIEALERSEDWDGLEAALRRRIEAPGRPAALVRADWVRLAQLCAEQLGARDRAVDAWRAVRDAGDWPRPEDELAALLEQQQRWGELASLREQMGEATVARAAASWAGLGAVRSERLDDPTGAASAFARALACDPGHAQARVGARATLVHDAARPIAVRALAHAYRATDDSDALLAMLDDRLEVARDARERVALLREAIVDHERRGAADAAFEAAARALLLAPDDDALADDVAKLGAASEGWLATAEAFRAAGAVVRAPRVAAQLRGRAGEVFEHHAGDDAAALDAYLAALLADPDDAVALRGVARLGPPAGRWAEAARAIVRAYALAEALDPELLAPSEAAADAANAWADAARAFTVAIAEDHALGPRVARDLEARVATWHRDHREAPEAAERCLRRALARDPEYVPTLLTLAALQRRTPGAELVVTLARIAALAPSDLDPLCEAAEVALGLGGEVALNALRAVYDRAAPMWRDGGHADGVRTAEQATVWALERLIDYHRGSGNPARAVALIEDARRLPLAPEPLRALRVRGAAIASDELGAPERAARLLEAVVEAGPRDLEANDRLAAIYREHARLPELLALRQRQLARAEGAARLALRLELSEIVGAIERSADRVGTLRANLDDAPGHAATIDALAEVLAEGGRFAELCSVLEGQADKVEALADAPRAGSLWERAAAVNRDRLGDVERAIAAYRRAVSLAPTPGALDALAALHLDREEFAEAVPCLEQRLALAEESEKVPVALRLSRAYEGSGEPARAIHRLEGVVSQPEAQAEVRVPLARLYRATKAWEQLAALLTDSLPHLDDEAAVAAAREAADVYVTRLDQPARAVPALRRAAAFDPGDRGLQLGLARGLAAAGALDAAEAVLEAMLEQFGRRRSPERARIHYELSRVVQAQGDAEEAIRQLEQASQMDVGNAEILGTLAQLARSTGQLERAERAYQGLLLAIRRRDPSDDEAALGAADVLAELHFLAAERGDADLAAELIESAIEAAVQSDVDTRRLRRVLLARGAGAVLVRALQERLEIVDEPEARAQTLAYLADVLGNHLDRADEALDRQLEALQLAPARAELHRAARQLARSADCLDDYLGVASELLDGLRRKEDAAAAAGIALEVGRALEEDRRDLRGAAGMYRRAEATGVRAAETYSALARVAGALGDTQEQARALSELLKRAGDDTPPAERADALYQLAEVYADDTDTVADALSAVERALDADARYERAAAILRRACDTTGDEARTVEVYERVSRRSNRWEMLLDALERAAAAGGDMAPARVREGIEIAIAHDALGDAGALTSRAEALARVAGAADDALAAPLALAEHRAATGDLAGAMSLLVDAAEAGGVARVRRPLLELAGRAAGDDATVEHATRAYELIRTEDPTAREAWQPLMDLYLHVRNAAAAEVLARAMLPVLLDPEDRNALRLRYARFATDVIGDDGAAVEMLKDALLDQPDRGEAAELLEAILAKGGRDEDLLEFLGQRFDEALARADAETARVTARRLGILWEARDPAEAAAVYEGALELCPDDPELLAAMVRHLGDDTPVDERASWRERLLAVVEGDEVAALALSLAELREQLGDADGVERALERGAAAAPADHQLRDRLADHYRAGGQWRALADLYAAAAEHLGDRDAAIAMLREAAAIHTEQRDDEAAAAATLRRARKLAPDDAALLFEVASSLATSGDVGAAIDELGAALDEGALSPETTADALLARADLHDVVGDANGALADASAAYALDAERAVARLTELLEAKRERAQAEADVDSERAATMRLADLAEAAGDDEQASGLLLDWVTRYSTDREPLLRLRDLDTRAGRWGGVVAACARLVQVEQGDDQRAAALALAEAADRTGAPETARTGLERALESHPGDSVLVDRLRSIYQAAGAHRELAGLALREAETLESDARFDRLMAAVALLVGPAGQPDAAIAPLQQAAKLRPADEQVQLRLIDAMIGGGRLAEARRQLEPAIEGEKRRSPYLGSLQYRMAKLLRAGGDDAEGYEWIKKAFSTHRKDGEIAHELATWGAERQDYDVAIKALKAISIMDLGGPMLKLDALLMEARLEVERGNPKTAEMLARKVLREDPESSEAQALLDEIG